MRLEILVGMIASGKSTYSIKRAREGAIIVNDDAIVMALHANQYTEYKNKLKPMYKALENMIVSWSLGMDLDVVIDRPNLNPNTRRRYIEIARSHDCDEIVAIMFPMITAEDAARRRAKGDNRGHPQEYWYQAATDQHYAYKKPTMEEGFTAIEKPIY